MFKPRKVGWLNYGSRRLREGWGSCLKYFKRGQNIKEGRPNKNFEKGSKLGQVVDAFEKGGSCNPFRDHVLEIFEYHEFSGMRLGKKEYVSIKINPEKIKKQKKLL